MSPRSIYTSVLAVRRFPKDTVAACGQTIGSYRRLTGHWKYIHEPTVNLYQSACFQKTLLKKQCLPVGRHLVVTEG